MLQRSVRLGKNIVSRQVLKKSVGEKYLGRTWETSLGQEYWRSVTREESWGRVGEKCWRRVLERCVEEDCCRDVLYRNVQEA